MTPPRLALLALCLAAPAAAEEVRRVWLEDDGTRIHVASLTVAADGRYAIALEDAPFTDHFLSMRPFRCIAGPERHLCHVPYPYEIARDLSDGTTDLEYDLLFVWKDATDYGIDMWNGLYHRLSEAPDGRLVGTLHEMDMGLLAVPPAPGERRPIRPADLEPADPDGHWLPRLVVE